MVVVAVAGLWTLLVLLLVRQDLQSARSALETAREAADADSAGVALADAGAELQQAVDRMGQPGPVLVAQLPLVRRPVLAVDRVAEAALAVTVATDDVVETATGVELLRAGSVDLEALEQVRGALDRAAATTTEPVAALVDQSDHLVPGTVAEAVNEAQDELAAVPETFARAAAGVQALTGLLGSDRPRRLLVALENNAELRGAGGVVTVFAEATARDGRLDVGSFRDVEDVADDPPDVVRVPAPADYQDLWGPFLADSTLWVNTNMSPDVPTSSQVLAEVAAASLPERPDAVLWVDVPAIAAVLEATGPAQLPDGSELAGDDAVEVLLSRAYVDAPDTRAGQAQRRATLRAVADAVLSRLLGDAGAPPSLTSLGPALAEAGRGRHLALWSADDGEQELLRTAGLAGGVEARGGDLASFAVQNLGGGDTEGNKLDYYARRSMSVRAVVGDWSADVVQDITLRNDAPPTGLPRYVAGGTTPGTTNNLVTLALPEQAELVQFSRGGRPLDSPPRAEGDHAVVVDLVSLPPGTSVTWELRYRLPLDGDGYRLALYPQPLHADADLQVELRTGDGRRLEVAAGSPLTPDAEGVWMLDQPFASTQHLAVESRRPAWPHRALDGVRRFWNEPVRLP